ncbi:MAG: hypothetical protein ACE367_15945 [Acidimicrobiales bacterium]
MIRRSIAGLVLGLSLLLASLAWSGYLALRTVLDPDRSREVAVELLDNDEVRDQLAANLAAAVTAGVPEQVPVPDGVVEAAAVSVLDDPAFEELILTAFADTHAAFLGEGDPPERLDLNPVANSFRATAIAAVPALEGQLPADIDLTVDLPTEYIPDASPLRSFLQMLVPILAIAAAAGAVFALVTTTDRPSVLRRAGTWAIGATLFYLAIGLGLPWLLRNYAPDGAEIFAALLTAFLRSVVTPSLVLGGVGLALILVAALWPEGARERSPRQPRRAAPEPRWASAMPTRPAPQRARPAQQAPVDARATRGAAPGAAAGAAGLAATQRRPAQATQRPAPSAYPDQTSAYPAQRSPYPDQASPYPDGPTQPMPPRPPAFADPAPRPGTSVFADADTPVADPRLQAPTPPPDPTPRPAPVADATVRSGAERMSAAAVRGGWLPPRWVEGHGWVLDPNDPKPPPSNARWVDGVGHVVPGPPP